LYRYNEEDDLPDLAALKKLRVADLKEILVARGLPVAGLKADLVQRLDESRAPEKPEVESEEEEEEEEQEVGLYKLNECRRPKVCC
jgi:ribosomal protein L12E/L44/L45/RPP1/RPP2